MPGFFEHKGEHKKDEKENLIDFAARLEEKDYETFRKYIETTALARKLKNNSEAGMVGIERAMDWAEASKKYPNYSTVEHVIKSSTFFNETDRFLASVAQKREEIFFEKMVEYMSKVEPAVMRAFTDFINTGDPFNDVLEVAAVEAKIDKKVFIDELIDPALRAISPDHFANLLSAIETKRSILEKEAKTRAASSTSVATEKSTPSPTAPATPPVNFTAEEPPSTPPTNFSTSSSSRGPRR